MEYLIGAGPGLFVGGFLVGFLVGCLVSDLVRDPTQKVRYDPRKYWAERLQETHDHPCGNTTPGFPNTNIPSAERMYELVLEAEAKRYANEQESTNRRGAIAAQKARNKNRS
jgi:hypothetical protein